MVLIPMVFVPGNKVVVGGARLGTLMVASKEPTNADYPTNHLAQ